MADDSLAGIRHALQKMILRRQIVEQLRRFRGHARRMDVGLSMGGGDTDADVLQRAAEAAHGVSLKMRQHKDGIIIVQMLSHDVFIQMEASLHRNLHLSEFIHDVTGSHGLKAMLFNGLPVKLRVLALSAVGSAALDDRSVKQVYQIPDQLRMQIVVSTRFAGGNLHAHLSIQFLPQRLIDPDQTFRGDFLRKINLCLFHFYLQTCRRRRHLFSKIRRNFLHPRALTGMERAASVAVAAADAGVRLHGEFFVMIRRHMIAGERQVIVFIDQPHVDSCGTGLTVIAVHTVSLRRLRGEFSDYGVVLFPIRRSGKAEQGV